MLSPNENQNVLVTGGAGFIGSHLATALVAQGYEVHVLDNLSSGKIENIPAGAIFHHGDITDSVFVNRLFQTHKYSLMFHQAAQMSVIRSVKDPVFDAHTNIVGLVTLMNAMANYSSGKVIFASSGGVIYGEPVEIPQTEDHPLVPLSPYGISKKTSEEYLRYFWEIHKIPYVSLRYANVYGPHQNPNSGAGVIAIFMEKILNGQTPVINGTGDKTRDYVHVSDVVNANLQAIKYQGVGSFNVGTGIETSVLTIFRMIKDYLESDIPEVFGEDKKGEQLRSALDNSKASQLLNWNPTVGFSEGLKDTIDWYLSTQKAHELPSSYHQVTQTS